LKIGSPFLAFGGFDYLRTCANSRRVLAKRSVQKTRMRRVARTVKFNSAVWKLQQWFVIHVWLVAARANGATNGLLFQLY
jgi:hypothetical protein